MTSLVALFATSYALFGIFRHRRFVSSAYDLGIFDQAVWHLSRFEAPASTISGFSNILGDHFYPVIALFAPLYWIAPSPYTLIVAQALLLAASIVPVHLFLRARLPERTALVLSAAYALSWGIQQTAAFDVHEMAFAPLAIATLVLAMDRRQWTLFWAAACFIALIKEDLIPFLTGVGVYLALTGERRRGAVLAVTSVAAFVVISSVVVPALSDAGAYAYTSAYQPLLQRPWTLPLLLVTPLTKLRTAFLWFAPFGLLSLASPLSLLIVPLALERLLSSSPQHWGTVFHYTAPIAPLVAMSAGDGLARVLRRFPHSFHGRPWVTPAAAVLCLLLAAVLPGRPPLRRIFSPEHYRPIAADAAGRDALALVPPTASVIAQAAIGPHLSQRDELYVLRNGQRDAEVVIASRALNPWPFADAAALAAALEQHRLRGYRVVFERDGWTVLRAPEISPTDRGAVSR